MELGVLRRREGLTLLGAAVFDDVPVSYTHLRAHETPEHLVCRLLLEKNNPNHYLRNSFAPLTSC